MTLEGLSGLGKLSGLRGLGKRPKSQPTPLDSLPTGTEETPLVADDLESRVAKALGDERLAKKIVKLKEKFPLGSMPELVAYEWMERKKMRFLYQQNVFGGRARRGGYVPDFIVDRGGWAQVWQVQGNYWHSQPGQAQEDQAMKFALTGATINGLKVNQVIFLWESRIMNDDKSRERVFNAALGGRELGR